MVATRGPGYDGTTQRRGKTRSDILNVLKRSDGLSADQLAERIGVTTMAVRKHLAALEHEALIESDSIRQPIGRPVRIYRLSEASDDLFPNQYDSIAVEFLSDLVHLDGPDKVDLLFNRRAERTFDYLRQRISRAQTFEDRVAALASGMDELGYLASWEKVGPNEFVVNQYNCAIQRVASVFPQACFYELETYRRLLDADIERSCHMMSGDHYCCYTIRPRESGFEGRSLGTCCA